MAADHLNSDFQDRDDRSTKLRQDKLRDENAIGEAALVLRAGGLVAFPTETVYGLGAVATDDRAVAGIFAAKGRPRFNPLIVHVADRDQAGSIARWTPLAERLAERFWPGPLTLILERSEKSPISMLVSAGGETVAMRAPAHLLAEALLRETGLPIAGPSANPAGKVSPTTADHVIQGLGDRVDLVLDGGPCTLGLESTVLDVSTPRPRLLRPGGLPREEIEAFIGEPLILEHQAAADGASASVRSPGQLRSHYAPRHPLRLDAEKVDPDEALLAFGPTPLEGAAHTLNLSRSGDLREAAGHLFAMLHDLDRREISGIAVMSMPTTGLGEAILDRLQRAAVRP